MGPCPRTSDWALNMVEYEVTRGYNPKLVGKRSSWALVKLA